MIYHKNKRFYSGIRMRTTVYYMLFTGLMLLFYFSIRTNIVSAKEKAGGEIHAFYPSNAVYSGQIQKYIDEVDSLSFAWSRIDASDPGVINTVKGQNGNQSFYYPDDYLQPVRYAKSAGKSIQLNIYMKGSDCVKLLPYQDKRDLLIKAITEFLQKDITQGEKIYFDGVVIDFEGLRDTDGNKKPIEYDGNRISTYFTQFLAELKEELNITGKKLYAAVNPRLYYDGYNYGQILKIADRVILMAHDYEPSGKLSKGQVRQYTGYDALEPANSMAPIQMVRLALNDMQKSAADTSELSKVWLQLCFDSAQWKFDVSGAEGFDALDDSCLSKEGRYTPLYSSIKARIGNADGAAQNMSFGYNNELQTPYIQYYNLSDKTWNVILYEGSNSITAKIELAKEYGAGGISLWSLANVPDYNDTKGQKYHLNVWETIVKEMDAFDTLPSDSRQNVSFTDTAIEQAVRDKLGKWAGSITKNDLLHIYRLKLSGSVKSLNDLKNLKNLEYLDAGELNLKSIKALESLKNLRVLYLQRNKITDLTPLKKLNNLEILSLNGNRIISAAPLSALTNLRELYIRENKIENISFLGKLTELNTLEIGSNKIKSLKSLNDLKKLRQLSMENNEINNLKGVSNLTGLKTLDLSNNKISDIQYLKNLTGLEQLYLQRNSIYNIQALSGLMKLKEISLNGNRISDLKPLTKLTSLEKLYLKENQISNITVLKALNNLKELYLSGNRITNYSPLKELYPNLQKNCDFQLE